MAAYTWNAAEYEKNSSAQKRWAAELLDKLALQGHEHVLDLGCGDGKVTAEIARRVPQGAATGVDYSGSMMAHALTAYAGKDWPNLNFAQADARALPFEGAFHAVFSNAVLHWVRDHRAVLAGLSRSLRPGGRALLQMGGRGNAAAVQRAADEVTGQDRWRRYFEGFEFPYSFYSPDDYDQWLPEAGLTPVRLELIPKDMTHAGREGLTGWMRTTWLPYSQRVPEADREQLVSELVGRYLEDVPVDSQGLSHVAMIRLEVEAVKP